MRNGKKQVTFTSFKYDGRIVIFYDILSFHDGVLRFCAYYVRNIMFEVGSVPGDALIHHFS